MTGRSAGWAALSVALTSVPAFATEEGGGGLGEKLITPEPGIFIWTLLTFLVVVLFLGRFAWKPLLGALESREQTIRETIEQAHRDREHASKLLEEQKALLAESRKERAEALEKGQREAEELKADMLKQARSQREQMMKQTEEQIAAGLRQARNEMRDQIVDLSIQAASKLMTRNLDDPTQRRLVEDYLDDMERGGGDGRSLPS